MPPAAGSGGVLPIPMGMPATAGSSSYFYTRPRATTLDCANLLPRCERRRLADYCSAFAEKTGRISRNVRGKLASWRLAMPHNCPGGQRAADIMHCRFGDASFRRRYGDPTKLSGITMDYRNQPGMMHSYGMDYEQGERYEELASRRPTTSAYSRDIIRSLEELELNRIDHHYQPLHHSQQLHREFQHPYNAHLSSSWTSERPYATLPKRHSSSRATTTTNISLEDQFLPRDLQRLSRYPKSLQDLKYLEIEAILGRDSKSVSYPPREQPYMRREDLSTLDDRPSRSSSRASRLREDVAGGSRRWMRMDEESQDRLFLEGLAGGSQIERYEPGKVHYEREYRIYGKDTVALIFYKTCYL